MQFVEKEGKKVTNLSETTLLTALTLSQLKSWGDPVSGAPEFLFIYLFVYLLTLSLNSIIVLMLRKILSFWKNSAWVCFSFIVDSSAVCNAGILSWTSTSVLVKKFNYLLTRYPESFHSIGIWNSGGNESNEPHSLPLFSIFAHGREFSTAFKWWNSAATKILLLHHKVNITFLRKGHFWYKWGNIRKIKCFLQKCKGLIDKFLKHTTIFIQRVFNWGHLAKIDKLCENLFSWKGTNSRIVTQC